MGLRGATSRLLRLLLKSRDGGLELGVDASLRRASPTSSLVEIHMAASWALEITYFRVFRVFVIFSFIGSHLLKKDLPVE